MARKKMGAAATLAIVYQKKPNHGSSLRTVGLSLEKRYYVITCFFCEERFIMQTRLVTIGNSQGIRLPKAVIEQAGLTEQLVLEVSGDAVIIRSRRETSEAWAKAAKTCHQAGEDLLEEWDTTTGDFAGIEP
ncbi:MAG: AbrB/MazE/SpoVT family DNA-binding domain-containing protein [Pirellulales bacterium]|nr:AbrB/MazE/SpoVT family DNA-binding domain-containing protein [Pirellulales bacterium]